jgi:hypothetical protein
VEDREQRDDREARERRAEDLRRRIEEIAGGEAGERPRPRSPHEFVEEQMREEAERRGDEEDEEEEH